MGTIRPPKKKREEGRHQNDSVVQFSTNLLPEGFQKKCSGTMTFEAAWHAIAILIRLAHYASTPNYNKEELRKARQFMMCAVNEAF